MEVQYVDVPFTGIAPLTQCVKHTKDAGPREDTHHVDPKRQQRGDEKAHSVSVDECAGPGTPYPELREDHDLSPKEQKIRKALMAHFPTMEKVAEALGLDPARFRVWEGV